MSGREQHGPVFVVLDGVDGCGKSTQAALLVRALERTGRQPVHLREPGSTRAGEQIRTVLLSRENELSPAVEALLFCAARRHMLETLVRPALAAGQDVVCERFHPSTFAYQGVAGGLGEGPVLELLAAWAAEPEPDRIVVIDLDVQTALERRGASSDRIEDHGAEFQRRVAEGYRRYVERTPGAVLVDGTGTQAAVFARVASALDLGVPLDA